MKRIFCLVLIVIAGPWSFTSANGWRKDSNDLGLLNRKLKGKVIDHTANHGQDLRMWSRSLYQRRDLYVYVPPCFDPQQAYPIMIYLHGFCQDEKSFLDVVPYLDGAICEGLLPPLIIACPDGTIRGEAGLLQPGSFYVNSKLGDFHDFVTQDVWDFVARHYPLRSERQAHVLAGLSMGGFGAYNIAIQHRYAFGVVAGFFPALNLRWVDDRGNYRAKFDPKHWGWRTELHRREVIARLGFARLLLIDFLGPIFGHNEEALLEISRENPIEMIDRLKLREGELSMFVGYGGCDEFNIDAQIESFLYLCKFRGLTVGVSYVPDGNHDWETARKLLPDFFRWLAPQLAPFSPPMCCPAEGRVKPARFDPNPAIRMPDVPGPAVNPKLGPTICPHPQGGPPPIGCGPGAVNPGVNCAPRAVPPAYGYPAGPPCVNCDPNMCRNDCGPCGPNGTCLPGGCLPGACLPGTPSWLPPSTTAPPSALPGPVAPPPPLPADSARRLP